MADFCRQCSMETFGEDFMDLAGIATPLDVRYGKYAEVICEGCGLTFVDNEGVCVSPYCEKQHGNLPATEEK